MGYGVMVAGDGRGLFVFVYLRLGVTNIIILYFSPLNNNILTNYKTERSIHVETVFFLIACLLHKRLHMNIHVQSDMRYIQETTSPQS